LRHFKYLDQIMHRNILQIIELFKEDESLTIITTMVVESLSKNIHQMIDEMKDSVISNYLTNRDF
jgi:hypothetical protein